MPPFLNRPLPPLGAFLAGAAILLLGALYCFAYNLFQGTYEDPFHAARWALANLVPWLLAFEASKRLNDDPARPLPQCWRMVAAALLACAILSVALEAGLRVAAVRGLEDLVFQMIRRLPAAGLVVALLVVAPRFDSERRTVGASGGQSAAASELPLLPSQIDWVRASANYLEFRFGPEMTLKRMTMLEAEQALRKHGFVRIHRSALVNRERIRALEHGKVADEVVLLDGTRLRVGGIYRAAVRSALKSRSSRQG